MRGKMSPRIVYNYYCIVKFYYLNVTDLIIKYLENLIFLIVCKKNTRRKGKRKIDLHFVEDKVQFCSNLYNCRLNIIVIACSLCYLLANIFTYVQNDIQCD